MKFTSRRDVEAPAEFVFAALKDFDAWERAALRRGADVARTDSLPTVMPGLSWLVKFAYRGKERRLALRLTQIEDPGSLGFSGTGALFEGTAAIEVMALAARRARLSVTLDVRPRTIAARLILQSLRLAKARMNRRFADRVERFCTETEARYRQSTRA